MQLASVRGGAVDDSEAVKDFARRAAEYLRAQAAKMHDLGFESSDTSLQAKGVEFAASVIAEMAGVE